MAKLYADKEDQLNKHMDALEQEIQDQKQDIFFLQKQEAKRNEFRLAPPNAKNAFKGHKIVHLDLKGAPPKMQYLLDFVVLAKSLGATGFLIEYEDMFPWKGRYEVLKRKYAYSEDEVRSLLKVIRENGMIAIPLIQTFGHAEFILKHKEFKSFRETVDMANSVCPSNPETFTFLKGMLDQVIKLHPHARWFHLGGDEVWNIKTCKKCRAVKGSKADLYKSHMLPLVSYISSRNNSQNRTMRSIIWDDMLRGWSENELKQIAVHADPMVWAYGAGLSFSGSMMSRYAKSFKTLWVASSFKGALKPWSNIVPTRQHASNHISWLNVIGQMTRSKISVTGIALTGWSRYDHYGTMCELLPVAIPTLGLCLAILSEGGYDSKLHLNVSKKLGYRGIFPMAVTNYKNYSPQKASYPGNDVISLVEQLESAITWHESGKHHMGGWGRLYQVTKGEISHHFGRAALSPNEVSLKKLIDLKSSANRTLSKYFDRSMVDEWIEDKVNDWLEKVNATVQLMKTGFKKSKMND